MRPFSEDELTEVIDRISLRSPVLADITLIAGWTGLRWGELRALRVGDLQELPSPAFRVARSQKKAARSRSPRVGRRGECRWQTWSLRLSGGR
jgi:integrase